MLAIAPNPLTELKLPPVELVISIVSNRAAAKLFAVSDKVPPVQFTVTGGRTAADAGAAMTNADATTNAEMRAVRALRTTLIVCPKGARGFNSPLAQWATDVAGSRRCFGLLFEAFVGCSSSDDTTVCLRQIRAWLARCAGKASKRVISTDSAAAA